ncbi:SanA/YdcF family protein [Prosthecobacter vanneervenii]|uniref:SanA protein n=1 Tax=Prosthecobacter vanneervenii TaxID=48466 RepID=A0A7W7YDH1_9BACT|nr:ElyC/SanA/YdcF family protein [Prosthecobacter vanneervenii]MBB5034150.1 SanA protein [Prosthecobacter vanneervenii]
MKSLFKRWWLPGMALVLAGASLVFGSEWWVAHAAQGRCYDSVDSIPAAPVAVVLGAASRLSGGRPNLFFLPRMEAAAALFKAGRVKALIVSGDNSRQDYDEPTDMKHALMQLGVPVEKIVCDYAGFRTLDSVVRAREVFGQQKIIFVSQRFHNARAIYLARAFGIDAWGLDAGDVPVALSVKTFLREKLACVKAVLDVNVLHTRPKHLGEKVSVPLD